VFPSRPRRPMLPASEALGGAGGVGQSFRWMRVASFERRVRAPSSGPSQTTRGAHLPKIAEVRQPLSVVVPLVFGEEVSYLWPFLIDYIERCLTAGIPNRRLCTVPK
jgi:hypothetical protein